MQTIGYYIDEFVVIFKPDEDDTFYIKKSNIPCNEGEVFRRAVERYIVERLKGTVKDESSIDYVPPPCEHLVRGRCPKSCAKTSLGGPGCWV